MDRFGIYLLSQAAPMDSQTNKIPRVHLEAPTSPPPNEFGGIRGLEVAYWEESRMEVWWASMCLQMAARSLVNSFRRLRSVKHLDG